MIEMVDYTNRRPGCKAIEALIEKEDKSFDLTDIRISVWIAIWSAAVVYGEQQAGQFPLQIIQRGCSAG
jgi:hypothetical protein